MFVLIFELIACIMCDVTFITKVVKVGLIHLIRKIEMGHYEFRVGYGQSKIVRTIITFCFIAVTCQVFPVLGRLRGITGDDLKEMQLIAACVMLLTAVIGILGIIGRTDFLVVEGENLRAKKGIRFLSFSCSDLTEITCERRNLRELQYYIYLKIRDKRVLSYSSDMENLQLLAQYLCKMNDERILSDSVIASKELERLKVIAGGKTSQVLHENSIQKKALMLKDETALTDNEWLAFNLVQGEVLEKEFEGDYWKKRNGGYSRLRGRFYCTNQAIIFGDRKQEILYKDIVAVKEIREGEPMGSISFQTEPVIRLIMRDGTEHILGVREHEEERIKYIRSKLIYSVR